MALHDDLVKHWSQHDKLMNKYWNDERLIKGSKKLAKKIATLNPESVFEVGMYNGRNLFHIHECMPDVKIGGLDVNKDVLDFAATKLPYGTAITHQDALHMDTNTKYDVVFTHGVLMHISPDTISGVIDNILEKATKYIVHIARPEQDNKIISGPAELNPGKVRNEFRWQPKIVALYAEKGYQVSVNKVTSFGTKRNSSFIIIPKGVSV